MGNAMFNCMLQPASTVRVLRTDGEVLEFDLGSQVIAKQLMKAYPGHLVVHCSQVSRGTSNIGQRSKVSMMRGEDILLPGQTYCLLRVPTQAGAGKVLLSRALSSTSGQTHGQNGQNTQTQGQSRQENSNNLAAEKTNNNHSNNSAPLCRRKKRRQSKKVVTLRGMMFGATTDVRVFDGEVVQGQQHQYQQYNTAPQQYQQHPNAPWRPQLDAIIESPLNPFAPSRGHSITMSPLARQAGYIPASAMSSPAAGAMSPLTSTSQAYR